MKCSFWRILILTLFSLFSANTFALWQCYVADKGGHLWESKGLTQDHALAVATKFCEAYSPNGNTCHKRNCLQS